MLHGCLKVISQVSAVNEGNISSTLEEKVCILAWPCNILYIGNYVS